MIYLDSPEQVYRANPESRPLLLSLKSKLLEDDVFCIVSDSRTNENIIFDVSLDGIIQENSETDKSIRQ